MGVVILVLLVACANLANFLLAKSCRAEAQISTRLALGSTRTRIVRQIMMEALLLPAAGGVCGLALACLPRGALIGFVASGAGAPSLDPRPDLSVLAFTFPVSVLTGSLVWPCSRHCAWAQRCQPGSQHQCAHSGRQRRTRSPVAAASAGGCPGNGFSDSAGRCRIVSALADQSRATGLRLQSHPRALGDPRRQVRRRQAGGGRGLLPEGYRSHECAAGGYGFGFFQRGAYEP